MVFSYNWHKRYQEHHGREYTIYVRKVHRLSKIYYDFILIQRCKGTK